MEQNQNEQYTPVPPWTSPPAPQPTPAPVEQPFFPTGKRELLFGLGAIVASLSLINCLIFAGANFGFALAVLLSASFAVAYLWRSGRRPTAYSMTLLGLCAVITLGFIRSNDGFVKFIMVLFLFFAINLALSIQAGQNRRDPAGIRSLCDAPGTFFGLGIGKLGESFRGLFRGLKNGGSGSKKAGAVLLGLVVAVPVLVIVLPLLISADAAFEGLMDLLPDFELGELFVTLILGSGLACILYTRGTALRHAPRKAPARTNPGRVNMLTVNTVLIGLCVVYAAYLLSQLAYFVGGFSGVLPEGFTMAEYARRGFFEMAWLCVINLGIMALAVGLVEKAEKAPLSTRLLCLFVGIVTVFFVATASAKMGMYIGSYGLTRLRVLTEVIMVFLGLATLVVCLWLFMPKMPYMKVILILALVIGAAVLWADVDTVVAAYNVRAYQAGKLETVDVEYLTTLSSGAVPYIIELSEAGNREAGIWLTEEYPSYYWRSDLYDFRSWNIGEWLAGNLLEAWKYGN